MKITPVESEVLSPARPKSELLTDDSLAILASLLDDAFRIPGTAIRFGLDPLIGLVPGLGDLIGGLASFVIIFAAWQRGLPRVTISRMLVNNAIDTLLGTVPFAGDIFDVAWKANRKNLNLLQRESRRPRRQQWRDWLFLAGIVLAAAVLMAIPVVVLLFLVRVLRG